MINIGIIDDHKMFREGVSSLLLKNHKFNIQFSIDDYSLINPDDLKVLDLLILDVSLKTMSGIDIVKHVKPQYPNIKIIMLSMNDAKGFVSESLEAGANLFISKSDAYQDLSNSIESLFTEKDVRCVTKKIEYDDVKNLLSKREKIVLDLLMEGKSQKDIASVIDINYKTVSTYKRRLMNKLDVHTDIQLIKLIESIRN